MWSPGLVVMGSNPGTMYWMDFFHIYCCKNCKVCLKRLKINDKRGRGWPILKNNNNVLWVVLILFYALQSHAIFWIKISFFGSTTKVDSFDFEAWLSKDSISREQITSNCPRQGGHFLPLNRYDILTPDLSIENIRAPPLQIM